MPDATITIKLDPEAEALIAKLKAIPTEGLIAMAKALDQQNHLTVGHAFRKYLSFPKDGPTTPIGLRAISNRLRGSYAPAPAVISGQRIESAIGSNVSYAAVHEFGFDGEVGVRAHTRRLFRNTSSTGRRLKKKVQTGVTQVGEHTMHMHMPARAPIQHAIADRKASYGEALGRALIATLKPTAGQK